MDEAFDHLSEADVSEAEESDDESEDQEGAASNESAFIELTRNRQDSADLHRLAALENARHFVPLFGGDGAQTRDTLADKRQEDGDSVISSKSSAVSDTSKARASKKARKEKDSSAKEKESSSS